MIRAASILGAGIRGWRPEPADAWRRLTQAERYRAIARGARSRGSSMRFAMVARMCIGGGTIPYEVMP